MTEFDNPYSQYTDSDERKSMCEKMVVAMAYVPDQDWETPYDTLGGLDRGTLFPSLDKPWLGGGSK
ncbi:spore coat associated protein CotJA [Ruminiclostridium cellobioparum]|jgi:hypothetical protein|uniref:Spore coat associated protein JA (CotJA) n=1 Tax=Ruminiclostridium cellobioparum subsp. termitidis CT1112 TaxID=1195236 RepID=S0FKI2_RUMCE|nr:spore coat associated protein CotJA [Ruminiclostridium cellobioparum]EMS72332.1 Spore coat associated protein JA (CotJA) [Ruminiclostridium cellobioparum subsp. termitidis CT1112]